jgi:TatD DNase family protein
MMIDSHSHLFLEEFSEDLSDVIARAKNAGVAKIFMPNIDSTTLEPLLDVCERYKGYCYPMIGLHPTSVGENYLCELDIVRRRLAEPDNPFVAVGEIGIDLYWDKTYELQQIDAFEQQVELALEYNLPIVIHAREAFNEVCSVIDRYRDTNLRGVFHSFTGTVDDALRLLGYKNFMIGVNGVLTFKKSTLPDVLPAIPLDRLLLETDSPYLTPVPFRGRRNESSYIEYTMRKVAEVYGMECEEVSNQTSENALTLFGV